MAFLWDFLSDFIIKTFLGMEFLKSYYSFIWTRKALVKVEIWYRVLYIAFRKFFDPSLLKKFWYSRLWKHTSLQSGGSAWRSNPRNCVISNGCVDKGKWSLLDSWKFGYRLSATSSRWIKSIPTLVQLQADYSHNLQ